MAALGLSTIPAEHGKLSPLKTVRERTRDAHVALEAEVDLQSALSSREAYRGLLCRYLSIYKPFEAFLHKRATDKGAGELLSLIFHSNVILLRRDLLELGLSPGLQVEGLPLSVFPRMESLDAILGALYVVEGSSLGGQVIYRDIQKKLNLSATSGAAFFYGRGDQTGTCWKHFTDVFDRHVADAESAAEAACAMFQVFRQGLGSKG